MSKLSNAGPATAWYSTELACGTKRQRLHIDGVETPYFIDSARGVCAHRSRGDEHGLWGAGMGVGARSGLPMAACLGSGSDIRALKHRAEQMALCAPFIPSAIAA
jgi:hypothetical protein